MLKTLFNNPLTRTFIALIFSVALVLGTFLVYISAPESLGKTSIQFDTDAVYYIADEWSLAYDYMQFHFFPGTLIIPGYHHGRVVGVLLIPPEEYPGSVKISLPEEYRGELPGSIEDNLDQLLIMLDYADYKTILQDSGETILLRADGETEDNIPNQYLNRQMAYGQNLLTRYNIYGFTNWLLPTPQTILVRLWGHRLGILSYYEDHRVSVSGSDFDVNFPHPDLDTQYYPPKDYYSRAVLYIIFLGLAAGGLISFISGGMDNQDYHVQGVYSILPTTAALVGTLIYAFLLTGFQTYYQPSLWALAGLWALPLLMIGVWSIQSRLEPRFFGITTRGLLTGLVAAISVSGFITLGSTFSLPTGTHWNTALVISVTLTVMMREFLLRGFCQRILSHWLHPLVGLVITSLAWAVIVVSTGAMEGQGIVLPLSSAMGSSFLIGYMYYRTNNVFSAGLLAALLELAPLVMQF